MVWTSLQHLGSAVAKIRGVYLLGNLGMLLHLSLLLPEKAQSLCLSQPQLRAPSLAPSLDVYFGV